MASRTLQYNSSGFFFGPPFASFSISKQTSKTSVFAPLPSLNGRRYSSSTLRAISFKSSVSSSAKAGTVAISSTMPSSNAKIRFIVKFHLSFRFYLRSR